MEDAHNEYDYFSYMDVGSVISNPTETRRPERKSNMVKREYLNKSWSRSERRLTDVSDSDVQREPDPHYMSRLRRKVPSSPDVRSSPPSDSSVKTKVYQKKRFSADIPLVKRSKLTNGRSERKSSSLGDTFRKIIGKIQGSNGGERTKKKNGVVAQPPSAAKNNNNTYSSYPAFGNVDNRIPDTIIDTTTDVGDSDRSGRDSPQPKQAVKYSSYDEDPTTTATYASTMTKKRVTTSSPRPAVRRPSLINGSQTLDRNYRSKQSQDDMYKRGSPAQKYYLGEDPFARSIYGKEKEYDDGDGDGAKPFRRKYKNGNSTDDEKKSVKSQIMNGVNHIFGGRLSKSTNRLASDSNQRVKKINIDYENREVQTLPRKSKKQVFINDPSSDQENRHSRRFQNHNSGSMINVSVVNNARSPSFKYSTSEISGPQKPARTHRSSLLRSKSFNVQLGPRFHDPPAFKSNPQLHKLEESPPPLKSPGIVTSVNRSTRDLSKSLDDDFHSSFDSRYDYSKTNGYAYEPPKRPFLRESKIRAPQLYKTLPEDEEFDDDSQLKHSPTGIMSNGTPYRKKHKVLEYSNSFHSSNGHTPRKPTVSFESDRRLPSLHKSYSTLTRSSPERNNGDVVNKSVLKRGGNDDYSETVRITSKSSDPLRPSVTNTVQNFSKKTVPSKDGRLETIESSETTRVTKSHYRGDNESDKSLSRYNTRNGGVVIEVRNGRR